MTDIVRGLVDEIKNEIYDLTVGVEGGKETLEWTKKEYSRFMMVSSDDYADTIRAFLKENPEAKFSEYFEVLLKHLGRYGSTQAIFRASAELLEEM